MQKIKFSPEKDQACFGLDDTLIEFVHVIANQPEFTLCGQAITEYEYDTVKEKINCPNCIKEINHVKQIIKEEDLQLPQDKRGKK